MSEIPAAGQLWSFVDVKRGAVRYMRLTEVDARYVHGYAWWDDGGLMSGRNTRFELETLARKWCVVFEPGRFGGAA